MKARGTNAYRRSAIVVDVAEQALEFADFQQEHTVGLVRIIVAADAGVDIVRATVGVHDIVAVVEAPGIVVNLGVVLKGCRVIAMRVAEHHVLLVVAREGVQEGVDVRNVETEAQVIGFSTCLAVINRLTVLDLRVGVDCCGGRRIASGEGCAVNLVFRHGSKGLCRDLFRMEEFLQGAGGEATVNDGVRTHVRIIRGALFEELGIGLFVDGGPAGVPVYLCLGGRSTVNADVLFLGAANTVVVFVGVVAHEDFFGGDDGLHGLPLVAPGLGGFVTISRNVEVNGVPGGEIVGATGAVVPLASQGGGVLDQERVDIGDGAEGSKEVAVANSALADILPVYGFVKEVSLVRPLHAGGDIYFIVAANTEELTALHYFFFFLGRNLPAHQNVNDLLALFGCARGFLGRLGGSFLLCCGGPCVGLQQRVNFLFGVFFRNNFTVAVLVDGNARVHNL